MRVALYCRVSREEQVRNGLSLGVQIDRLRQWAAEKRATVVGEYIDAGVSGKLPYKKRPALSRFIQDIQSGLKVDSLVFIKLDRFYRNVKLYYQVVGIMEQYDVSWIATEENYDTATTDGRFKTNIMLAVAEQEADRVSDRIKFVFEDKKSRGEPTSGKIPYGYKVVDKHLVPDEETAPIAQEIFQKYLDLRSIADTIRWLWDSHGISRCPSGMRQLLSNKLYLGSDNHPALIDRETFQRAQELLASRANRHSPSGKTYLFGGLIYCRDCGKRMKAYQPAQYEYYICRYHADYGSYKCINKVSTRQDKLEEYLLDNLVDEMVKYNATIEINDNPPKDKDRIRRKMEKLKDLYLDDLIDKQIYERDYTALQNELYEPEIASRTVDIGSLQDTIKLYRSLSKESQKAVWGRILKRIEIDHDGNIFLIPN